MNEKERLDLINYRVEQAKDTVKEVQKLIDNDLYKVAVNRIYYGMFYLLTALALKNNFTSSKHMQLIGWFNKEFIKDKIIDPKYGIILREAFKNRSEGDYEPFVEFSKKDVVESLEDMKDFINEVEKHL